MKKGLFKTIGLLLTLVLCIPAFACSPATAEASSFVSVDINPSIELTLDANDKVMSVRGADEDGQVLLYGETSLVGLDIDSAIQKITDLAVELGYLNEDNCVVNTSVSAKTKELADKIREKVNAKITASVGDFSVTIAQEQAYSLVRQFEQFKLDYPEIAQNVSIDKFKLALSASETGEVDLEVAIEMDDKALIEMISNTHKQLKEYATEEFLKAKQKAEADFNNNVSGVVDGIYESIQGLKLIPGLNVEHYGDFMGGVRKLEGMVDSFKFEKVINYELTVDEVNQLASALQLENAGLLEDVDGKVTLGSVYGYLDKTLKNLSSEQAQAIKDNIATLISSIETNAKEAVQQAKDAYKDQIEALLGSVQVDGVDLTDGVTEQEVRAIIDYFKAEVQEILDVIEEHIHNIPGAKEALEIAKNFKDRTEYNNHLDSMEDKIDLAKNQAMQRLQALKALRKPA